VPVTADDFLWEATGFSASGTSVVVTHPDAGGTTAGTTVLIGLYTVATTVTFPAEFADVGYVVGSYAYVKSDVAAAETSWTFTLNTSTSAAWYMVELDNVSLADPFDGNAHANGTLADGATGSTGTLNLNAGSSGVAFAIFGAAKVGTTDVQSWSGYTNSFTERVDVAPPSGTAGKQIAVAYKLYEGWSSFETTATFATTAASASTYRLMVLLRSADASINAPLHAFTGFEWGTTGGMASITNPPFAPGASGTGVFDTSYSIQAGSARNGSYGLKIARSASIEYVSVGAMASTNACAVGMNVKIESGSGTPVVACLAVSGGSGVDVLLVYDVANTKLGVQWATGSAVWQTGTTPLDVWCWVDIRARFNSSVWHIDWKVETGTDDGTQTSPTDLTEATPGTSAILQCGYSAVAHTITAHYDDVVASKIFAAYPLGPHVVRLLVPETTGATVSGTSTNFQRFTANGTLANVNGTEGALLDDIPPTISASSDGVVQVTAASSDYIEIPMTTYTLAPNEIIAGVRALASLWGGTGSGTGTLGFRGYDGLTETTFVAASTSFDPDSLTAVSATYPLWYHGQWSGAASGAWTQTRLNAAALRGGYSTDATPDMGFSAMYLEVAIREIYTSWTVHRLTSDEDPDVNAAVVTETLHPYNSGVRTFSVSNDDPTRTAEFNYSISGTPQTPVVIAPTDPPVDVTVGAEAFGEVDSTAFGWQ
jgi:hypothetical protein